MKLTTLRALGAAAVLSASVAPCGCHVFGPARYGAAPLPAPAPTVPAQVEMRDVEHRPRISLVARLGDPSPAVAMAVAHDLGSTASTVLAAILQTRLEKLGFPQTQARPEALGLQVRALVHSPAEAGKFVRMATRALRTPLSAHDPALPAVARALEALEARSFSGSAEQAVAACTGELGVRVGAALVDPRSPAGLRRIEAWRKQVATAPSVAFAALGPAPLLNAAARALSETEAWPESPAPRDPWPTHDVTGVDAAGGDTRTLSVALRVGDGSVAIEAARKLAEPHSALSERLGSMDPAFHLERVVGTTRPRGACVRVDVHAPGGKPAPRLQDVADATLVTLGEVHRALSAAASSEWTLEDSVLRPSDPRDAAAIAAWRALSGRLKPGPERVFVSYSARRSTPRDSAALEQAIQRQRVRWQHLTLDQRARVEPGQSELWALIASPCGTVGESADDAGLSAMVVRSLATERPRIGDVRFEPWVSPDGIGLLAHAPRQGPHDTPEKQAARVGNALGRALVTTELSGTDVARTRANLLHELGPGPEPGWWLAVESAAPDHPSWLEPRGTWQSITSAATHAVEERRRELLRGPLRVAVIANWDRAQVATTSAAIERWLAPLRGDARECPAAAAVAPRHGELNLETSASVEPRAAAYVSVPLPHGPAGLPREAEWTALLLNRQGGWLDQALRLPGLASSAHATVLGGSHAAALVIEVTAVDDKVDEAVAQVRGLLARLGQGAASADDAAIARRRFQQLDAAAALDPRQRIVDLWRGTRSAPTADLASLRRFQHEAFQPGREIVVYVHQRD